MMYPSRLLKLFFYSDFNSDPIRVNEISKESNSIIEFTEQQYNLADRFYKQLFDFFRKIYSNTIKAEDISNMMPSDDSRKQELNDGKEIYNAVLKCIDIDRIRSSERVYIYSVKVKT